MLQVDLCRKRQNTQQEHTIIIMLNMCPHFMQEKKINDDNIPMQWQHTIHVHCNDMSTATVGITQLSIMVTRWITPSGKTSQRYCPFIPVPISHMIACA